MCGRLQYITPSAKLTVHRSLQYSSEMAVHRVLRTHEHDSGQTHLYLLLEHFFDPPDLFLDFPSVFFGVAFGL
jgi:hypothetical protein